MNARRKSRLRAVQFLYQLDLNPPEDMAEALTFFWEEHEADDNTKGFAEKLIKEVFSRREELDNSLQSYAERWDVKRMNVVDRNILRLAIFEILHRNDIPPVVSVNEAVELAKLFSPQGDDDSAKFVNGILDRCLKEIHRPLRTSAPKDA